MELSLLERKKQALIDAKAEVAFNKDTLDEFLEEPDENASEKARADYQMALKKYHQVNLIKIMAVIITTFGLVYYILNNQPNFALLMLASFAAGHLFDIRKP